MAGTIQRAITYFSEDKKDTSTRKRRHARMREILSIVRSHNLQNEITPEKVRNLFEDLGPVFVKMGQTLSTRSEVLPKEYRDELSKLRAEVAPVPYDQVLLILEKEFGTPLSNTFQYVDPTPHGSASIAQVHKAVLTNGEEVALKIQRPNIRQVMAEDISIMRRLARSITFFSSVSEVIDLIDVVDELWETFQEETDFLQEAANMQEFLKLNSEIVYVTCPKVYTELSSREVLVMEYINGIKISDTDALLDAGYDINEIGYKLVENFTKQLLDDGYFHADPHAGNLYIFGGKIVFLDWGIVGRLGPTQRELMGEIIKSVGSWDLSGLKSAMLRFGKISDPKHINHPQFLADLDMIIDEYGTVSLDELDIGAFLTELFSLSQRNKVKLPTVTSMIARSLVTLEGLLHEFLPETNLIQIITDHLRREETAQEVIQEEVSEFALTSKDAVKNVLRAATKTSDTLDMLNKGQLKFNMELQAYEDAFDRLGVMTNRLAIGMIIAGLFVGSSILCNTPMTPKILGIPILGLLGYLGAAILSVWLIGNIIRANWHSRRRH